MKHNDYKFITLIMMFTLALPAYIEELNNHGYSEIASEGNNVSVETMLQKDNATLSIAYSGTVFNILIAVDSTT